VYALTRRWWLIALVALLAAAAALAWTASRPRDFRATADVLVTPIGADDQTFLGVPALRQSGDTARVVQTAVGLLDTPEAARRTARELGGSWTEKRVRDRVDAQARGASTLVAITARSESAAESARIANAFASSALAVRKEQIAGPLQSAVRQTLSQIRRARGRDSDYTGALRVRLDTLRIAQSTGDPSLSLTQEATVPTERDGGPAWVYVLAALIAGGMAGAGLALALEAVRPSRVVLPA
jgi:uncharacterized protein involved in exopolysaccharide biosynthesis